MMNLDTEVLFNGMMIRKFRTMQFKPVTDRYSLQAIDLIVLEFLSTSGSQNTLADMEKLCLFTKGHLSQSVKRLQEGGYLRCETDQMDRRRVHNYLTDQAVQVVKDFDVVLEQAKEAVLAGFSEEERKTLIQFFRRINQNVKNSIEAGSRSAKK